MRIGLIGAGNMASALARGLGEPVVVSDIDRARAEALAHEVGGEVARSNVSAAATDAAVLAHKPAQLAAVAAEIRDEARAVISILGGVPVAAVEEAYPDRPVYRFMPSIPVEVRQGVVCYAPGTRAAEGPEKEIRELFGRLGTLIELPESSIDAATAVMSCGRIKDFRSRKSGRWWTRVSPTASRPTWRARWPWSRWPARPPSFARRATTRGSSGVG